MKKKLAIVSSYDVICGNAAFSEVLMETISKENDEWSVWPVDLNLTLNQNLGRKEVRAANRDFQRIAAELKTFDAVNIQFEAGLYGILPKHVVKRLTWLLLANPKTSITYHSPRTITNFKPRKDAIRALLRGQILRAIRFELDSHRVNFDVRMNRRILGILKRKDIPVIVHTLRSKDLLTKVYGLNRVEVHPIILTQKELIDKGGLENVRDRLGLSRTAKLVGLFGFISQYKGHLEALEALRNLPSDISFVVAGRIHPQSLGNPDASNYVKTLVKKISADKQLMNRVFFVGELDDKTFESLVASVDCCLLPYHEVGQDGSGIASICFEAGRKVVASNSYAFDELVRLIPSYKTYRFDIENSLEMARQIERAINSPIEMMPSQHFTLATQAEVYVRSVN